MGWYLLCVLKIANCPRKGCVSLSAGLAGTIVGITSEGFTRAKPDNILDEGEREGISLIVHKHGSRLKEDFSSKN